MSALQEALRAIREETRAAPGDGQAGLRRVLDRTSRRGFEHRWVLTLALMFAGTAAAVAGVRWIPRAAVTRPVTVASAACPDERPHAVPPLTEEPLAAAPTARSAEAVSPPRVHVHRQATGRGGPETSRARDSFRAEDETFEKAQREHVDSPGSAEELVGWDVYLERYPHGRFEPEARYRRAIALAGLQRWDEARSAFAPFAEGAFGDYRHAEAANWLRAMPEP
jgi:hypothetical protein